ncbi:unnamed protein product [Vitrella brassicaformis CCMP3155]|uniref:RING-type domain-containing protein n=1 Tax=Vitrella brassicaformis (strain CCMP3155) TaxID=1169540 RepID=A0A0G4H3X1_VITBC|nr:unnamed protein product [Vitrella brassicaformis CCMP3155]|eukprot:CEM38400.1 unnamed protein product [Vitrella brassicaformis CCMP3155]
MTDDRRPSSRRPDVNGAIAALSSPDQLSEDALDTSLGTLVSLADAVKSAGADGEVPRWVQQTAQRLCKNKGLLRRVSSAFTDVGHKTRQDWAARVLHLLCHPHLEPLLVGAVSSLSESLQSLIASLDTLLVDTADDLVGAVAFALLRVVMVRGRQARNATDSQLFLVQHHPDILHRAVEWAETIPEQTTSPGPPKAALVFLISAFGKLPGDGPPFPTRLTLPDFLWVRLSSVGLRVMTHTKPEIRDKWGEVARRILWLVGEDLRCAASTFSSHADCVAFLEVLQQNIYGLVDPLAEVVACSDGDAGLREGAAMCLEWIFGCCIAFSHAAGWECFASDDGPVQRLMRVPAVLRKWTATVKNPVSHDEIVHKSVPLLLAACGHRDAVYAGGCTSTLAGVLEDSSDNSREDFVLMHVLGDPTDLTDERAKIAVRDGAPALVCQVALRCIKGYADRPKVVNTFVDFAVDTLRTLVSYGSRVSSRRGALRSNSVTRAILQHEDLKTMRAAGGQPARRKGHQQQQLAVPQELLDLFDEIETAANERAEKLIADLADDQPANAGSSTKRGKKKSKDNKRNKGAIGTHEAAPSSADCGDIDVDPEEREDTAERSPGPSPPSPPRHSCSSYSPSAASAASGPSVSVVDGSGRQQRGTGDSSGGVVMSLGVGRGLGVPILPPPAVIQPPSFPVVSTGVASASSAGPSATSSAAAGGSGQQEGPHEGDDGGGFITVGRKKRGGKGTGGNAQQQQTNIADKPVENSRVFPSSSESTRPSSSQSSVSGGPHNAPALPFPLPPRPAAPPPQPPNRHTYTPTPTPAPSSSRGGSDEQGLAPSAAGGSSSSTLERAVEVEGRGGHGRCDGEVSELDALRQQLEAMRLEKEAILKQNEAIKRENERLQEERESTECDVCMAEKKSIVLIPCRHFCLCGACAAALMSKPVDQRLCPRCRQATTATRHVYL